MNYIGDCIRYKHNQNYIGYHLNNYIILYYNKYEIIKFEDLCIKTLWEKYD